MGVCWSGGEGRESRKINGRTLGIGGEESGWKPWRK